MIHSHSIMPHCHIKVKMLNPFSKIFFIHVSCKLGNFLHTQNDLERYDALIVLWVFTWMEIQNNSLVLASLEKKNFGFAPGNHRLLFPWFVIHE